jgi:hypothetical protein
MSVMSELDSQVSERTISKEYADESSDFILTQEVTADNAASARQFGQYLREKCDCRGSNQRWDNVWLGKGGKLVTTYTIYVDGIEYAIERQNDAKAWIQTDIDRQCGGY